MSVTRVHLVGSIALDSVRDVFGTVGAVLGQRVRRVPDGEPGSRRLWISYQYPLLRVQPFLQPDPSIQDPSGFLRLKLTDDSDARDVHFGELGYAREARISYQDFVAARAEGKLPSGVRFQVSLPTPMAVTTAFISPSSQGAIESAYEAAVLREVKEICSSIPHSDLCLQWDLCIEMLLWDGRWKVLEEIARDPKIKGDILGRIRRLTDAVPKAVEVGFHLCYGDYDAKHFVEPLSASKLVEFANALAAEVGRPIAYIHMPVPIDRADDEYFAPLGGLKLSPGTELYLGLVHSDGVEPTKRRIAAATKYVSNFGIATECGMGRSKTPQMVRELLQIHAGASTSEAERQTATR